MRNGDFELTFSASSSTDVQIDRVGFCSNDGNFRLLNEYLESYAFLYVLKGNFNVRINGKITDIKEGEVYYFRPETAFSFEKTENKPSYMFCSFDGNIPRISFEEENRFFKLTMSKQLQAEVKHYVTEEIEDDFCGEMKTLSLIYYTIKEFAKPKETISVARNPKNDFIDAFIMEVGRNYRNNFKVEDICKKIGISVHYFTGYFTKSVKISPRQFVINYKINKAKGMLENTDLSVSEIAQYVGYEDPFTFSKIFKKKVGLSPVMYSRQQKKQKFDIKGKK
ncbi:MAG: helix-turn-helix domain-containing protein [Christensenellales bacterium]